jgi:muconolactone delta-isomerase
MRFVVIDRGAKFPLPPEQMPALWPQFVAWRERYRDRMESFEFFIGGGGGFGVVNVDSAEELQQMLIEYPFTMVDEVEVRPIADGDASLAQWGQAIQAMAGA